MSADIQPPRVSVIVPVRNRREMLAEVLGSLEKQTFTDFEVIVVDDGSTDGSADEAAARVIAGRPVRVLDGGGRGAVAARNLGAAAATGSILAFTDSDCVAHPRWLTAGVSAADAGADVVNGTTRPVRQAKPGEHSVASGGEGLYPTCNVFYRREAFEEAGGFETLAEERLAFTATRALSGLGFGEDTLLAWRVRRKGSAAYAPDAIIEHQVFSPGLAESLRRRWQASGFPGLIREVPELRETMVRYRVQLGSRTRAPVYAAALLLLVRRPRLALACVAWWVAARLIGMRRKSATWPESLRALPAEMLEDVVTAAALTTGSVRARTPLL